jgi:hypothetical protein
MRAASRALTSSSASSCRARFRPVGRLGRRLRLDLLGLGGQLLAGIERVAAGNEGGPNGAALAGASRRCPAFFGSITTASSALAHSRSSRTRLGQCSGMTPEARWSAADRGARAGAAHRLG